MKLGPGLGTRTCRNPVTKPANCTAVAFYRRGANMPIQLFLPLLPKPSRHSRLEGFCGVPQTCGLLAATEALFRLVSLLGVPLFRSSFQAQLELPHAQPCPLAAD